MGRPVGGAREQRNWVTQSFLKMERSDNAGM
jgi:hypothetical protein